MNFEFNLFLIIFILVVLLTVFVYPIFGYFEQKKLVKSFIKERSGKIKWYRDTIIWLWVPVFIILLLIPLSGTGINDLGLKEIDIDKSSLSKWVIYLSICVYGIYLLYNLYSIFALKYSKENRTKSAERIPKDFRAFLPITKKEKSMWSYVVISAGITEEIVYRGYLFFALGTLFPDLSVFMILVISTLIFGIGHIYQGLEVIKSTIIGLFLGFMYIIFDSIIPVIVIHIAQDLVVLYLLDEE